MSDAEGGPPKKPRRGRKPASDDPREVIEEFDTLRSAGLLRLPGEPELGALARTFGDNLRLARLELRMTQDELSARTGISRRHISLIESGDKSNATLATVERLALHVGRTPLELLTPRPIRQRR